MFARLCVAVFLTSTAIRVPFGELVSTGTEDKTDYSKLNKFKTEQIGDTFAIVGLGNFFKLGQKVKKELKKIIGIDATLINPKYISSIDEDLHEELKSSHKLVITLEDGILDGGFGEKITRSYGTSKMKVLNFGAKKEFTDKVPLEVLYEQYHLTTELIVQDIINCIRI